MYLLFHILFHYDLSQYIEYVTVLYSTILYSPNIFYSKALLFIQSIYNTLHLLTATSQSILPALLGNLSLFSISVSLLDKDSSIVLRKVILTPDFIKTSSTCPSNDFIIFFFTLGSLINSKLIFISWVR